jgi:excisionase family DNA binding protein
MEKALRVGEVSATLDVGKPVVYHLLVTGELEGRKVGRQWRCSPEAVKKYLGGGGNAESKSADPREAT